MKQSRFDDQRYVDWLKCTLSLLYLKEGIEDIVNKEANSFHTGLLKILPAPHSGQQSCNRCTSACITQDQQQRWYLPCPSNICNLWLEQIVNHHSNQNKPVLCPENTNPLRWPISAWEVCKTYMPKGCHGDKNAKDADLHSILTLFERCQHFRQCGQIERLDLINELIRIRNYLYHGENLQVESSALEVMLKTMLDFLAGMQSPSATERLSIQLAVDKIIQLKTKKLDLSMNRELELEALQMKTSALQKDLSNLELQVIPDKAKINPEKNMDGTVEPGSELDAKTTDRKLGSNAEAEACSVNRKLGSNAEVEASSVNRKLGSNAEAEASGVNRKLGSNAEAEASSVNRKLGSNAEAEASSVSRKLGSNAEAEASGVKSGEVQGAPQDDNEDMETELDTRATDRKPGSNAEAEASSVNSGEVPGAPQDDNEDMETELDTRATDRKTGSDIEASNFISGENPSATQDDREDMEIYTMTESLHRHKLQFKKLREAQASINSFLEAHGLVKNMKDLSEARAHPYHKLLTVKKLRTGASQPIKLQPIPSTSREPCQPVIKPDEKEQQPAEIVRAPQETSWHIKKPKVPDDEIASMRSLLIQHYRSHCLLVPHPASDDLIPLDDLYVEQDLKVLRESDQPRSILKNVYKFENHPITLSHYREIFYTDNFQCQHIYVQGEAGSGKTMFCKHLVNMWCKAHAGEEKREADEMEWEDEALNVGTLHRQRQASTRNVSEEDRQIMTSFGLLFYITLRDSLTQFHISDMIDAQLLRLFPHKRYLKVSNLLDSADCLIILDGLDEWKRPEGITLPHYINADIPGRFRFTSQNAVFLTTTRPWAYDIFNLKNSEVDKHVELKGLNINSSSWLCSKVLGLLNKSIDCKAVDESHVTSVGPESIGDERQTSCIGINDTLLNRPIVDLFHSVPFILIQLVCLWFDNQSLGNSHVQLYCRMLEMLLKRAEKNLYNPNHVIILAEPRLPYVFLNHPQCWKHKEMLIHLSKIAFEALFDKERPDLDRLVFEFDRSKLYELRNIDVLVCLKSGILSQHKMTEKYSVREKRLTFLHKSLHEFLAALYTDMHDDPESLIERITAFCSSIEAVLEKGKLWMFLCGLNPNMTRHLWENLVKNTLICDGRLQQYRHTSDSLQVPDLLRGIQTCVMEMVQEAHAIGQADFSLPLEDLVIFSSNFCRLTVHLIETNLDRMRSVYITMDTCSPDAEQKLRKLFGQLSGLHTLQKIYIDKAETDLDVTAELDLLVGTAESSLASLELLHLDLTTELAVAISCRLASLTTLSLWQVRVTHGQKEFLLSMATGGNIRELSLYLDCIEHGVLCRPSIDLSGYEQIEKLHLWHASVDDLKTVSQSIEEIDLGCVTMAGSTLKDFIAVLAPTSRKVTVGLNDATIDEEDSDAVDQENAIQTSDLEYTIRHTEYLLVTQCKYDDSDKTWWILFHKESTE